VKPNVIFLDFDGVVCNPATCHAVGNNGLYSYLDPIACQLLKRLCIETNSKLVISSSWRIGRNYDFFYHILSAVCPNLGEFVWCHQQDFCTPTTVFSNDEDFVCNRGREIEDWLKRHPTDYNRFVILDDDSDMEPLMDSFVKCDAYDGFGFEAYQKAKKLLIGSPFDFPQEL